MSVKPMSHVQNRDHIALAIRANARPLGQLPEFANRDTTGEGLSADGLSLSRRASTEAQARKVAAQRDEAPASAPRQPGFWGRLWTAIKSFFGVKPAEPPKPQAPRDPAAEAELKKLIGADDVFARLLVAAGFKSLNQVANTAPETILAGIKQANAQYGVAKRLPSLEHVRAWVGDAKRLTAPSEPPAPAKPAIQAWFTDTYQPTDAANRPIAEGNPNNPEKHLIKLLDSAKVGGTIDAALFELHLPGVADALVRAKRERNVTVRVVTDTDYYYNRKDRTKVAPEIQKLLDAGIPVVQDNRNNLMHNKFLVIDGQTVWTGSLNVSEEGAFNQNNNSIQLESKDLAENYTYEFDWMFTHRRFNPNRPQGGTPHKLVKIGNATVETLFSEENVSDRISELVRNAKSVKFMAFSFTDDQLGSAMRQVKANGGSVEGVFERVGANSKYGEYQPLKDAGADVHLDGNQSFMHHKVIILDEETDNPIVITGSYNFSKGADDNNDENALIISGDKALTQKYVEEFKRVKSAAIAEEIRRAKKAAPVPKATAPRDGAAPLPAAA
jgi:phosphatidylserine/phosphatidylglycerophosphate/cardiolipin synthase-like enzyme